MCKGERIVGRFRSQGGANVLSVHVWVVGGHHGGVICPQMDCLSVGLLWLTVSILGTHGIHLCKSFCLSVSHHMSRWLICKETCLLSVERVCCWHGGVCLPRICMVPPSLCYFPPFPPFLSLNFNSTCLALCFSFWISLSVSVSLHLFLLSLSVSVHLSVHMLMVLWAMCR